MKQTIEIDVDIEELETRAWPRPRSVNAYKIEREYIVEISAGTVPRGPAFETTSNDEQRDRHAA
jgi:hypothetical protein